MNYQQKFIKYQQKFLELIGGADSDITKQLICPITNELMVDPVLASDGYTYERDAILTWFSTKNTSPMTNAILDNKDLKKNQVVISMTDFVIENKMISDELITEYRSRKAQRQQRERQQRERQQRERQQREQRQQELRQGEQRQGEQRQRELRQGERRQRELRQRELRQREQRQRLLRQEEQRRERRERQREQREIKLTTWLNNPYVLQRYNYLIESNINYEDREDRELFADNLIERSDSPEEFLRDSERHLPRSDQELLEYIRNSYPDVNINYQEHINSLEPLNKTYAFFENKIYSLFH